MRRKSKNVGKLRYTDGKTQEIHLWPVIYCTGEEKVIAYRDKQLSCVKTRDGITPTEKVDNKDDENWEWRTPSHKIFFAIYKRGDKVLCPKCGAPVDFRAFPSERKPEFV